MLHSYNINIQYITITSSYLLYNINTESSALCSLLCTLSYKFRQSNINCCNKRIVLSGKRNDLVHLI